MLWLYLMLGAIILYNRAREPRAKLTRSALLNPRFSPWRKLYSNGDEAPFLNLSGSVSIFMFVTCLDEYNYAGVIYVL
jgi:hypothetical protein